jgi:hypothetical protein
MPRRPAPLILLLLGVGLALGWLGVRWRSHRPELEHVRARYHQMERALATGDTATAQALLAPALRARATQHLAQLTGFVKPLNRRTVVVVSDSTATVCPLLQFHFGVIPGGHSLDLIKLDGEWYFTGAIHID